MFITVLNAILLVLLVAGNVVALPLWRWLFGRPFSRVWRWCHEAKLRH